MNYGKVSEDICYNKLIEAKFLWKVRDFLKMKQAVTSPEFPTAAPDNVGKWNLELKPYAHYETLCICVRLFQKKSNVVATKTFISLLNEKGATVKQEISENSSSCILYFERDFVLNADNGVLLGDDLAIACKIQFSLPHNSTQENLQQGLTDDLSALLCSESLSDVTIVVGAAELRAHKAILAARSPVFAAMFRNHMMEKETSVVKITDVDADVFREMLEFMYTGKETSEPSGAHDLLVAATKYQLETLKLMCEDKLCQALSLYNVLENLALADLYDAPRLKNKCINFVMGHKGEVLKSSFWDTFKRSHQCLGLEVLENICLHE